ncbi:MAG: proline--tRNA ligase [Spirochaetales bacterium]|nr:proline--tRNA ligase [Spirochaetales bacterium]
MKYSRLIGKTGRKAASGGQSGASLEGYTLLLRGGFVHLLGQGLISYLPLGMKVVDKLKGLIAEEMTDLGGEEFLAPMVNPLAIWNKSGRSGMRDNPLVTFKDARGRTLVLAPTHEEAAVELIRSAVSSYRDFPIFIYQFQSKFRDEARARLGLVRAKEFIMKDAYSFHRTAADLNNFFPRVFNAYRRIFERCSVPVIPAESGVGIMGGSRAYEFLYPHQQGRDVVMICPDCGYRANRSVAIGVKSSQPEAPRGLTRVETSECSELECLSTQLDLPYSKLIKPRVYESDRGPVMAVVRGDYDVSMDKLTSALGFALGKPASRETLERYGLVPGYMSPISAPKGVTVIVDEAVVNSPNLVMGENEEGHHYINVNFGRDFDIPPNADIAQLNSGDLCLACGAPLDSKNAIEMGNIFKLDDFYTRAMNFSFEDDRGRKTYPLMGSYGMGIGRLIACIAENNRDEHGLIWPLELAPYTFYLMGIGRSIRVTEAVEELAEELGEQNVIVDDRLESIGVKFRDAAIMGIPLRIVVGRRFLENDELELKDRKTSRKWFIQRSDLKKELKKWREDHERTV